MDLINAKQCGFETRATRGDERATSTVKKTRSERPACQADESVRAIIPGSAAAPAPGPGRPRRSQLPRMAEGWFSVPGSERGATRGGQPSTIPETRIADRVVQSKGMGEDVSRSGIKRKGGGRRANKHLGAEPTHHSKHWIDLRGMITSLPVANARQVLSLSLRLPMSMPLSSLA
jgi:hypothetical protein